MNHEVPTAVKKLVSQLERLKSQTIKSNQLLERRTSRLRSRINGLSKQITKLEDAADASAKKRGVKHAATLTKLIKACNKAGISPAQYLAV